MSNWEHKIRTEAELKELVRDVYDCKLFTSLHCENHMIGSIFMTFMFIGMPPTEPSFPKPVNDIRKDRKNKLLYIDDLEQWRKNMKEYDDEEPKRVEFINTVGMLYEQNSKAGPMSVNGYPIFMSCNIVSISDTKRFIEMYKKYEEMREEFEKEWK